MTPINNRKIGNDLLFQFLLYFSLQSINEKRKVRSCGESNCDEKIKCWQITYQSEQKLFLAEEFFGSEESHSGTENQGNEGFINLAK